MFKMKKYGYQAWGEFMFRTLFGLFFFAAGVGHALNFDLTVDGATIVGGADYAKPLAVAASVFLIAGGLSLMAGFKTRWGAVLIVLFLIPATLLHESVMEIAANTAAILDPQATEKARQPIESLRNIAIQGHQANVMKNLVLTVAALFFVICGAGEISADRRRA